jgi:CRP/FNR family transcriptional regulator, cyclic AMP receptor protein
MLATVKQTEEFIDLFRKHGKQLTYAKGEFIIRPGDVPSGVFFIESGLVKAYDITKYGEENLLIIRKSGEIFPLIWAITGQERHVIYESLSPTVVWQLKREKFTKLTREYPSVTYSLLSMTVEMYRIHSERIINLEYRSVRERLISFLLTMAQRFGKRSNGGMLIKVPLRHQDIASAINSSRETTSREMVALERKGLLTNEQTYITLKDIKKLRSFL